MQFKVPKYLERDPVIVGPLSFKKFIYFAVAGAIAFYLYFIIANQFLLFLVLTTILMTIAGLLAFARIEGVPLPDIIVQSLSFIFRSKLYLWKRKKMFRKIEIIKEKKGRSEKETSSLRISPKANVRDLSSKIEMGKN
jgi:hypothetical protein